MMTIGFLNPSYVIQNYIQVTQLDNLIKYLEKLIKETKDHHTSYNKDYTALLLNCYVKKDKKDAIAEFLKIKKTSDKPIFDVDTAIEVCRQQDSTRDHAIMLAEKMARWKLLVQIYIENQKQYKKALNLINWNICNVREKVDLLQMYGPKLLKECERQERERAKNYETFQLINDKNKDNDKSLTTKDVMQVALDIVISMVYYKAHGNQFIRQIDKDKKLELGPKQEVLIEDLLQIFVDHHDLMTDFLK